MYTRVAAIESHRVLQLEIQVSDETVIGLHEMRLRLLFPTRTPYLGQRPR